MPDSIPPHPDAPGPTTDVPGLPDAPDIPGVAAPPHVPDAPVPDAPDLATAVSGEPESEPSGSTPAPVPMPTVAPVRPAVPMPDPGPIQAPGDISRIELENGLVGKGFEGLEHPRFVLGRTIHEQIHIHGVPVVAGHPHGKPSHDQVAGFEHVECAAKIQQIRDGRVSRL